jgi:aminopeptidase N
MITPANRYKGNANLGSLAYIKPSIMLLTLRSRVLDSTVFDAALREYVRRWAFKHPYPADFIRTIEDVSGRDLAWFWRGWIYTTAALDMGIESVTQRAQGGGNIARITLRNQGQQVMPVTLTLTLQGGATQVVRLPVEIWYNGDRYLATVSTASTVVAATLNADGRFPDVNPANDAWKGAP